VNGCFIEPRFITSYGHHALHLQRMSKKKPCHGKGIREPIAN